MRPWVTVVVGAVLLAGCGTAAARPGSGAVRPGSSTVSSRACSARSGQAVVTLADTAPRPTVTVRLGAAVVVTVPRWGWGTATDVNVASGRVLREKCSVVLRGGGRRTIFQAVRAGRTSLGATVAPASNLMMPAWGGEVIVSSA